MSWMLIGWYRGQLVSGWLNHGKWPWVVTQRICWTFFSGILNVCYQKTIYWISFKFIAFSPDAYRCLHMNLLSSWMSFRVIWRFALIWVNNGMVVFYGVIETQCTWNFDRFVEFKVGNERPLGIILFTVQWYGGNLFDLSCRSDICYLALRFMNEWKLSITLI